MLSRALLFVSCFLFFVTNCYANSEKCLERMPYAKAEYTHWKTRQPKIQSSNEFQTILFFVNPNKNAEISEIGVEIDSTSTLVRTWYLTPDGRELCVYSVQK